MINLPSWLLNFISNIHISKYPFFISYKPNFYKINGIQLREIINLIEPGDILLRKQDGYLNNFFTKGCYSHAGLFVGSYNSMQFGVIHVLSHGVVCEDIFDFCRTDHIAILRVKNIITKDISKALEISFDLEKNKTAYDYMFSSDNNTVYCTELIDICYQGLFKDDYEKTITGHNVLYPDAIYNSLNISIIKTFTGEY